jgi:hypothetical protein
MAGLRLTTYTTSTLSVSAVVALDPSPVAAVVVAVE